MALRNQPYIPLYVQDFLTDEKLMECSASATGIYIRLMCVMHKSETYGTILLKQKDKQNEKQILNFAYKVAKFLPYDLPTIVSGIEELLSENVIQIDGDLMIQKRMYKDGIISDKRASAGSNGGKKTAKKLKDFATAKPEANTQANSEYENEVENEVEIKTKIAEKNKIAKIDFEEIVKIFNSVCVDLPVVEKISKTREKAIENRIKEFSLEQLGEVFRKVHESDFLSGRKTDWKANFDWIMNPTNFIKILEDNYKNNNNGTSKSNEQIFRDAVQSEIAQHDYFK
jgi:uncharacterized protein YdaU (DUF1376 family)